MYIQHVGGVYTVSGGYIKKVKEQIGVALLIAELWYLVWYGKSVSVSTGKRKYISSPSLSLELR